jgi:hypothetical protein
MKTQLFISHWSLRDQEERFKTKFEQKCTYLMNTERTLSHTVECRISHKRISMGSNVSTTIFPDLTLPEYKII